VFGSFGFEGALAKRLDGMRTVIVPHEGNDASYRRTLSFRSHGGGGMQSAITDDRKAPQVSALLFSETEHKAYTASGKADEAQGWWEVKVRADGYKIIRDVSYEGEGWDLNKEGWQPGGVIWPAWPARLEDQAPLEESPLAGAQDYWAKVGSRLRDSAKWMATVLGAALAAIVGTAPLTLFAAHHPDGRAVAVGLVGVGFLYVTLFLVLQVMRPQSVSYAEVQSARALWPRSLYKWRKVVESEEDLYLPCGVTCLTSLRQSMIIEEVTLGALAQARASARDEEASRILCQAESARAARLMELRTACAKIATIGEYYKLRGRSTRATYGGILCSFAGTIAIIAALTGHIH
jgi:hypothetical protein